MKIPSIGLLPFLSIVSCASLGARNTARVVAENAARRGNLVMLRCFGSTPLRADRRPDKSQLSITTYNIDGLTKYDSSTTNRIKNVPGGWPFFDKSPEMQKIESIACTLNELNSDIVLLQEIDGLSALDCLKQRLEKGSDYSTYFVQHPNEVRKKNMGLLTRIPPSGDVTCLQDPKGRPQGDACEERVHHPNSLVCDIPLPDGRIIHLISAQLASLDGNTADVDRQRRLSEAFLLARKIWWAQQDGKLVIVAGTLNDDDPEHPGASKPFYYNSDVLPTIKGEALRNAAYMSHVPQSKIYSTREKHNTSHILVDKRLRVKNFSIKHSTNNAFSHYPVSASIKTVNDDSDDDTD